MTDLVFPTSFPVVVAGPSGSGKTTLCHRILERRDDLSFSVSATTRSRRPGEVEGIDYRFMDRKSFERMRAAGELIEWAEVHGELYGTLRSNLTDARETGQLLLLDIDVQGARAVRAVEPQTLSVFLLPPGGDRIVERLRDRGSEEEDAVRRRLARARSELLAVSEFDYVIVNDDLEHTTDLLGSILDAENRRVSRFGDQVKRRAEELADEIQRALT